MQDDPGHFDPPPGVAVALAPDLVRVLAPNPSAMTFRGTNTYLLGRAALCVIDPGPDDPAHLAALLAAIGGRHVTKIIVTHSHRDHSAAAPALREATGAPVVAFGKSTAGRSALMEQRLAAGLVAGGEGVDTGFAPDIRLADGAEVAGEGWQLRALHTPGHFGNHLCLLWGRHLFSGDHAMGWASSLVSPPDGDMAAYMASCARLLALGPVTLLPGHGAAVPDGAARLRALIAHRQAREAAIRAALARGPQRLAPLTTSVYTDTPPALFPAAQRNVLAHLIDLESRNLVRSADSPLTDPLYELV